MQHPLGKPSPNISLNVYDVVFGMVLMEQEVCVLSQAARQEIKHSANRLKA